MNDLADYGHLNLEASVQHGTTDDLLSILSDPNTTAIVTIAWRKGEDIQITFGDETNDRLGTDRGAGAHAMVVAAYDPTHVDTAGEVKPWGFVNSWSNGNEAPSLSWMSDDGFQRAWANGSRYPFVGSNAMVVIRKETH